MSVAREAGILAMDERAVMIPPSGIECAGDRPTTDLAAAALGRVGACVG